MFVMNIIDLVFRCYVMGRVDWGDIIVVCDLLEKQDCDKGVNKNERWIRVIKGNRKMTETKKVKLGTGMREAIEAVLTEK